MRCRSAYVRACRKVYIRERTRVSLHRRIGSACERFMCSDMAIDTVCIHAICAYYVREIRRHSCLHESTGGASRKLESHGVVPD